jgi:alpha-tubulin suppressor-like RCC1 family protein
VTRKVFLILLALVLALAVGLVACGGPGDEEETYNLTIASSTGGSVTTPGEGTFTYDEGEVVNLAATPDAGYQFANWTGDVSAIADVDAAATTITMNEDYSIMANFVALYDLTIDSSGPGEVTSPGEGTFAHLYGTVVDLVATPDAGCQFVNWTGDVGTMADVNAPTTTITMDAHYIITANFRYIPMIAADWVHTVGLKSDGTVVGAGWSDFAQCEASGWTGITQVALGGGRVVGLRADGTVVGAGWSDFAQSEISGWTDITQFAGSNTHWVGLKSDGTVVAMGGDTFIVGQSAVGNWTDIIQVAADDFHTVGLKSDGTVVAAGCGITGSGMMYQWGQCGIDSWTGLVQVAAGLAHTVGLKSDGTVVAAGCSGTIGFPPTPTDRGQCNVGGWSDIIQVAAGNAHTVGRKADGTVIAVGSNDQGQCNVGGWTDIIQVAAGWTHTVGLKADGTVVAVGSGGYNGTGACNVSGWDLTP